MFSLTIRSRAGVPCVEWTPAARPFFEGQRECPQGALGTRPLSEDDSLAWYVA